ncbi:predicted protein [Postia placenta Mad-698-R]|uniref:Uncharacterized protein n=1 Tax=Postia placenta MAD-698-R-SB12 TaxID=670580 RepID=A0A1X6N4J7_9APHY|nr:hypothetical protein POSPLADRAFT_1140450 [Postia placenta MAD-698-R-SB12]EED84960.1 predicted protein [Postia placenta Mad-698-R]OSX63569.1 hypothetical protein POSPLADRAFT_1140450 [Postia placenta MAD-698-R-SB12]
MRAHPPQGHLRACCVWVVVPLHWDWGSSYSSGSLGIRISEGACACTLAAGGIAPDNGNAAVCRASGYSNSGCRASADSSDRLQTSRRRARGIRALPLPDPPTCTAHSFDEEGPDTTISRSGIYVFASIRIARVSMCVHSSAPGPPESRIPTDAVSGIQVRETARFLQTSRGMMHQREAVGHGCGATAALCTFEKQTMPPLTDALAVLANMTAEFTLDEEQRSWPVVYGFRRKGWTIPFAAFSCEGVRCLAKLSFIAESIFCDPTLDRGPSVWSRIMHNRVPREAAARTGQQSHEFPTAEEVHQWRLRLPFSW